MQNERGRWRRGGGSPVCAVSGASTSCDDVCGRVAVDANVALTMPVANNTNRQPVSRPPLSLPADNPNKKQWKKSRIRHAVQCNSNSYGSSRSSAECPRPSPRIIFANLFFVFSTETTTRSLHNMHFSFGAEKHEKIDSSHNGGHPEHYGTHVCRHAGEWVCAAACVRVRVCKCVFRQYTH